MRTNVEAAEAKIIEHYMAEQQTLGQLEGRLSADDVLAVRKIAAHAREQGRLDIQLAIMRSWGLR